MIPELLNWFALYHNDYGGNSVDGELKGHKQIKESSPRDELLDNLDQEQCEGYTSKTGAHHVKRLLDGVVFERLNASRWVQGRQVSSKPSGNCNANESHIDHPTDLRKRLALSQDLRETGISLAGIGLLKIESWNNRLSEGHGATLGESVLEGLRS